MLHTTLFVSSLNLNLECVRKKKKLKKRYLTRKSKKKINNKTSNRMVNKRKSFCTSRPFLIMIEWVLIKRVHKRRRQLSLLPLK